MNAFIAVLFVVASASAGNIAYGGLGYSGVSYASPALSYAPAVASLPVSTYTDNRARISQSVRAVGVQYAQPAVVASPVAYAQPAVAYAQPAVAYAQPRLAVAAPAVATYAHAPAVAAPIGVSYGSVGALGVSSLGYGSAYLH